MNQPPKKPKIHAQPSPNPNTKPVQHAYTNEAMQYPTYGIEVSDVHLISRKQLIGPSSPQIIDMEDEEPIVEVLNKSPLEPKSN